MEIFPLLRKFITYLVQACFVSKIFLEKFPVQIALMKQQRKWLKKDLKIEETVETVETVQNCSGTARKQWETVQTIEIGTEGTTSNSARH